MVTDKNKQEEINHQKLKDSMPIVRKVCNSMPENQTASKKQLSEQSVENLMNQTDLFKAYSSQNQLYMHVANESYWFENGGISIGKKEFTNESKWKLVAKYRTGFCSHTVVVATESNGLFLLGPNSLSSCIQFKDLSLNKKSPMPLELSFIAAETLDQMIYTFGGFDINERIQVKNCYQYSIVNDSWSSLGNLIEERSMCGCAIMDQTLVYVFGGYNKKEGTLSLIEKFSLTDHKSELLQIKMPVGLRRLGCLKIAPKKILLLGGIEDKGKSSDYVYCLDMEEHDTIERLDKLTFGGAVESPLLLDSIGCIHLLIESNAGTSPPVHIQYSFLEYS